MDTTMDKFDKEILRFVGKMQRADPSWHQLALVLAYVYHYMGAEAAAAAWEGAKSVQHVLEDER